MPKMSSASATKKHSKAELSAPHSEKRIRVAPRVAPPIALPRDATRDALSALLGMREALSSARDYLPQLFVAVDDGDSKLCDAVYGRASRHLLEIEQYADMVQRALDPEGE